MSPTQSLSERIDNLRFAGVTVHYAIPRDAYANGYVSPFGLSARPTAAGDEPFAIVDGAQGVDKFDQSTTCDRSNFRALLRDFGDALVRVSWSNVDGLGFFVRTVSQDVIDTAASLAAEYPVYDDGDMSALEWEEITEAFDAYLWWDTRGDLSAETQDLADLFSQDELRDAFYARMSERGEYPEHSGLDVLWSSVPTVLIMTEAIEALAVSLTLTVQSETLPI